MRAGYLVMVGAACGEFSGTVAVHPDRASCHLESDVPLGEWTAVPEGNHNDCTCGDLTPDATDGDPWCHAVYEARVNEINGIRANLEFRKADGGNALCNNPGWLLRTNEEGLSWCAGIDVYSAVASPLWVWGMPNLEVKNVPVFGADVSLIDAGQQVRLALATLGADRAVEDCSAPPSWDIGHSETGSMWFQPTPITFTLVCGEGL